MINLLLGVFASFGILVVYFKWHGFITRQIKINDTRMSKYSNLCVRKDYAGTVGKLRRTSDLKVELPEEYY